MWIDRAESLGDAWDIRCSIDNLAVAGIFEVQHQRRSFEHVVHVAAKVPPTVKPSALVFDGPKDAFLDVFGSRDEDLSGAFSQHVAEEEVRVLLEVTHDNAASACDAPRRAFLLSARRN